MVDYEKIEDGELLKWEKEGVTVEGVLFSYKSQKTAMGDGNVYEVQTKDGIVPFFAPTLLHKKLRNITIGTIVKITYTKKTKTGGGTDLKHFDVLHAEPTEANLNQIGVKKYKAVQDESEQGEDVGSDN